MEFDVLIEIPRGSRNKYEVVPLAIRARNTCATCTICPDSTGWRSSTSS
jgi:hypothetical protein